MNIKFKNITLILVTLIFSTHVFANDKFCATSGVYFCDARTQFPDTDENCHKNPISALEEGLIGRPYQHISGSYSWTYTPWHLSFCHTLSYAEILHGVSQHCSYGETWTTEGYWGPITDTHYESVTVHDCKACPPGTTVTGSSYGNYCKADPLSEPVNNGDNPCVNTTHPINLGTGNKFYKETDYTDSNFIVSRAYNSTLKKWTFNYRQQLDLQSQSGEAIALGADGSNYYPHKMLSIRRDGKITEYAYNGANSISQYVADSQRKEVLKLINTEFNTTLSNNKGGIYIQSSYGFVSPQNSLPIIPDLGNTHALTSGRTTEFFDIQGRLTSIQTLGQEPTNIAYSDNTTTVTYKGSYLHIITDSKDRVIQILLPDNSSLTYSYNELANTLATVSRTYSDNSVELLQQYFYEDTRFPTYITGIEDANGNRVSSVQYDVLGRAISSEQGPLNSGIERSQVQYNTDGTRTLTNALGKQSTYHFAQFNGEYKITQVEGHPSTNCAASNKNFTYDSNGFMASKTDWKNNTTTYIHNDRGQELARTEASGTPQARSITTQWHADFNLPIKIIEPSRETVMAYDANGRLLSRQVQPRSN